MLGNTRSAQNIILESSVDRYILTVTGRYECL